MGRSNCRYWGGLIVAGQLAKVMIATDCAARARFWRTVADVVRRASLLRRGWSVQEARAVPVADPLEAFFGAASSA